MDNIPIRKTIIIKFTYYPIQFNNNTTQEATMMAGDESTSSIPATVNAAKSSCAVCGSQLHMTKHCPVHP